MKTKSKRKVYRFAGLRINVVGFPRPANVTSVTGPHPLLPWKTVVYYERPR